MINGHNEWENQSDESLHIKKNSSVYTRIKTICANSFT